MNHIKITLVGAGSRSFGPSSVRAAGRERETPTIFWASDPVRPGDYARTP